ncbi:MAG: hypothetical protein ABSA59_03070 [Terriglobia bacterium]|jgi:hypothetical protein
MKIIIDPLAITTFGRLAGVHAFISLLDNSMPEVEWREREALKHVAQEQDWDFGDYSLGTQLIDERFRHWIPRFSAYSIIILLQSIVETQLFACAQRVGQNPNATFQVRDIRGGVLESAVLYLRNAGSVDVRKDPAWSRLQDLHQLRNIIAHRGGTRGESPEHQKTFDRLLSTYAPRLASADQPSSLYGEMWISLRLCDEFGRDVEAFFSRTLRAIGVSAKAIPGVSQ